MSYYGGPELPEPVRRLAVPTICMVPTEEFGIDLITFGLKPDFQRIVHRKRQSNPLAAGAIRPLTTFRTAVVYRLSRDKEAGRPVGQVPDLPSWVRFVFRVPVNSL